MLIVNIYFGCISPFLSGDYAGEQWFPNNHGKSWGIFRDLELGENTDLSPREKALIGVGVASAISCPYCTYFHKDEARLSGVTDDELTEAVNLGAATRYFSTVLHGNEVSLDDFKAECDEIAAHIKEQHGAAADD